MKKIKILTLAILALGLCACQVKHTDPWDNLKEKLEVKSYNLKGNMELISDEDSFKYDIEVDKSKNNYYKVTLTNNNNNHEQIILKNKDGVYVVTPALNKSFKFQSQWPNNSSQSYLLESIIKDINSTKEINTKKEKGYTIVRANVNYPNNSNLKYEDIYFDKNGKLIKVYVLDNDNKPIIKMNFDSIKFGKRFSKNNFKLSSLVSDQEECESCKESSNAESMEKASTTKDESSASIIDDVVYPLYIPKDTSLASKEQVNGDNGTRFIMTYEGKKPFMIIEEASLKNKEMQVTNVYGDPAILASSVGALSDNSLEWHAGNMQYYISSSKLTGEEMLSIASSLTNASVASMENNK